MLHIGIVASSAEGAALCYRTICVEGADLLGPYNHPEVSMHGHPFVLYKDRIDAKDWAKRHGYKRLGVLGTRSLMDGPVYRDTLKATGIEQRVPGADQRERIHRIIFDELVHGTFLPRTQAYFTEVIRGLKDDGCDAVALACTEIPLLMTPESSPLPMLDSTRILARAALRKAVEG